MSSVSLIPYDIIAFWNFFIYLIKFFLLIAGIGSSTSSHAKIGDVEGESPSVSQLPVDLTLIEIALN